MEIFGKGKVLQHSWSILWAIPTPVTPHMALLQSREKPRRAKKAGWEDAPWHSRSCPALSLQLIWGVRRSSLGWALLPRFSPVSVPRGPGGGVGPACSSQKGGKGMERVLARDTNPLTSSLCSSSCLSTPRAGILCRPCQRGSRYGESRWQRAQGERPLRAARAGAQAPSPRKNATFQRQHPLCKPQPKQPGVNHGWDGAGLAPLALKTMELLRTCFSDPERFPRAHELFTVHTPQPDCHLQPLLAAP